MEIKIKVIRQLPNKSILDKGYKKRNPTYVQMIMWEIECVICQQPKTISNQELRDKRSLAHRGCRSKLTRSAEKAKLSTELIQLRIINRVRGWIEGNNSKRKRLLLSNEEIGFLIFANCFYCGYEPQLRSYIKYDIAFNGIDRINSSKPYIMINCVTCCKVCNIAKNSMTQDRFYEWLDRVAKFNGYEKR